MKRVVITGIGIISSIGNNKSEVLNSLKQGKSGIEFMPKFDEIGMKSKIAGNIKLDPKSLIDRKQYRFMGDAAAFGYLAMEQAISDADLKTELISNERTGLIIGSGIGSAQWQTTVSDKARSARGVKSIGAYGVTKTMGSSVSACLATAFHIKGVSYSLSSACATSAHCIGSAMEQILLGKQDIMFAGGAEELSWEGACSFDAMGAISSSYNDTPEKASRPFDNDRDGFVISAGSAVLVLEEYEHAKARGANIYAELTAYAATSDGYDMVAPSGEGAVRCMQQALTQINNKIDYINVHGTSTPIGDITELNAIREVFNNEMPYISSTKSMTGHSLGAAGAQEAIYSLLMLQHNFIAPSINIEHLDENAKDANIVQKYQEHNLYNVMSNSFGFGGTNATLVFSKIKQ